MNLPTTIWLFARLTDLAEENLHVMNDFKFLLNWLIDTMASMSGSDRCQWLAHKVVDRIDRHCGGGKRRGGFLISRNVTLPSDLVCRTILIFGISKTAHRS